MSEVKKVTELDRLKLENLKLKMDGLRPAVNQYFMLEREGHTIVKLIADGLKVKPEELKIDVISGQYEIMPTAAPKEKKDNAVEPSRRKPRK